MGTGSASGRADLPGPGGPTSTYYAHKQHQPQRAPGVTPSSRLRSSASGRELRGYGARKLWRQLQREGIRGGPLHRRAADGELGLQGVVGGKPKRTTVADPQPSGPPIWSAVTSPPSGQPALVADLSYVRTWSGFCYAAFIMTPTVGCWSAGSWPATCAPTWPWMPGDGHLAPPGPAAGLVHHSDRAANICRSAPPRASPRLGGHLGRLPR
jgi:hypothetical protein